MEYSVISKVQRTYPDIQENVNGLAFVQKASEFYEVIGKVNNSKAGLSFMKSIALGLCVTWDVLVEYIYYLVKEKTPSLYEDYEAKLDYEHICLDLGGVFGKLLDTKADAVFANKYLFDAVVANSEAVAEDFLQKYILEKYGWHNVMRDMAIIYNQYLLEEAKIAEKQDKDYIERTVKAINKAASKKKEMVISVAIADALTEDEYSTLYNWISEDDKAAHKLHLVAIEGKVFSVKEEVTMDASVETKESVEVIAPLAVPMETMDEMAEEPKEVVSIISPSVVIAPKKVITKDEAKKPRCKAVTAYCEDDKTIQTFSSVEEASVTLHLSETDIRKNLTGHTKRTGKGKDVKHYVFSYETPKIQKGKVLKIDPVSKEVVAEYTKVTEAERTLGYKPTRLNGVLKTVNRFCDGYEWMWEYEYKEKYPTMVYGKAA